MPGLAQFGNGDLDSRGEVTGDSTAVSFNLGALFLPRDGTRIGLAYRHEVSHELEGDGDFTTNETLRDVLTEAGDRGSPFGAFLTDSGATAEIDLPATFMVSVAQDIGDRVQLLGDITWTGWSTFEELRVVYDNPVQPDTLSLQEWEDVSSATPPESASRSTSSSSSAAASPSTRRRSRARAAHAAHPGQRPHLDLVRRGLRLQREPTLDVGYAHLFLDETPIDNDGAESPGSTTIRGEYDSGVDIFSAQLSWHFN